MKRRAHTAHTEQSLGILAQVPGLVEFAIGGSVGRGYYGDLKESESFEEYRDRYVAAVLMYGPNWPNSMLFNVNFKQLEQAALGERYDQASLPSYDPHAKEWSGHQERELRLIAEGIWQGEYRLREREYSRQVCLKRKALLIGPLVGLLTAEIPGFYARVWLPWHPLILIISMIYIMGCLAGCAYTEFPQISALEWRFGKEDRAAHRNSNGEKQ